MSEKGNGCHGNFCGITLVEGRLRRDIAYRRLVVVYSHSHRETFRNIKSRRLLKRAQL